MEWVAVSCQGSSEENDGQTTAVKERDQRDVDVPSQTGLGNRVVGVLIADIYDSACAKTAEELETQRQLSDACLLEEELYLAKQEQSRVGRS